jgi:hypothetical protein
LSGVSKGPQRARALAARIAAMEQTYRITRAGRSALESQRSVPDRYRAILGLLRSDTGYSAIRGAMNAYEPKQVRAWVEQLDTLGFLELVDPVEGQRAA